MVRYRLTMRPMLNFGVMISGAIRSIINGIPSRLPAIIQPVYRELDSLFPASLQSPERSDGSGGMRLLYRDNSAGAVCLPDVQSAKPLIGWELDTPGVNVCERKRTRTVAENRQSARAPV